MIYMIIFFTQILYTERYCIDPLRKGQKYQYISDLLRMIWMMTRRGVGGVGWQWTGHTGGKAWIGGTAKLGPLTMSLMSQSIWRYHQIDKCHQRQALPMDRTIHLSTRGRSRGNFERHT